MVYTYTVEEGNTASADLSVSSYTGTLADAAGNAAEAASGDLGAVIVDASIPSITSVSSNKVDGTYGVGEVIDIQVTFNEVVYVTGTPTLQLDTAGSTNQIVNYHSGDESFILIFRYTVQSGDSSSDLDYLATNSLTGTIKDSAGNQQH